MNGWDWRIAVALLGIIAATCILIVWQNRQTPALASKWLGYAALGLELLGLALSVFWAVNAPSDSIMPVIFVLGWIAMLVGRAILIPQAISKRTGAVFDSAVYGGLALAYLALYGSGLFHALNDSSQAADARLEASLPAQALDAEITATRQRLANLAGFADASKAHSEEQATAAAQAKSAGRINALQADLAAARAKLSSCPRNHITKCITPAQAEIASLQAQLSGIGGGGGAGGYASRHSEYNGVSAHLVELQKQRAALTTSGQGITQAWSADDRAIAWAFGITEEQANRVKWLIFTAIFDVLSLAFRVVSALITEGSGTSELKRKLCALIDAGVTPSQAVTMLDGATPPAYRYGGAVTHTGPAVVHGTPDKPEYVLSPEMTDHMGGAKALDTIREQVHGKARYPLDDVKRSLSVPLSDTLNDVKRVPSAVAGKRGKGRQGLIDTCLHCGQDYTVKAWTQVCCCPDCTAQLSGYADQAARQAAWNKGKKSA